MREIKILQLPIKFVKHLTTDMMDVDFPRGGVVKQDAQKKKSGKRKLNKENEDEKSAKKFVKSKYDLVWTNRLNLKV